MYYHQETNRYIAEGQQFELNGIEYSAMWLFQISADQIAEMGLVPVVYEGQNKDTRLYLNGIEYDGATIKTINTPLDLEQVKTTLTSQLKREAYEILQPTDYIEARNLRDPNYKSDWMMWRDQVRAYSAELIQNISLAEDVDSVKSILDGLAWPHDPNYVAPVQSPDSGEVDSTLI
jgi:hypothetical protein